MYFFDAESRIGRLRFLFALIARILALVGCVYALSELPAVSYPLTCAIAATSIAALWFESDVESRYYGGFAFPRIR